MVSSRPRAAILGTSSGDRETRVHSALCHLDLAKNPRGRPSSEQACQNVRELHWQTSHKTTLQRTAPKGKIHLTSKKRKVHSGLY